MLNQNNMKKLKNENIIVKTPLKNKYTHNKIFIFDRKYILMGSMNIMDKSSHCRHMAEISNCAF